MILAMNVIGGPCQSLWLACPFTRGRHVYGLPGCNTTSVLDARVRREVQHKLTVLLDGLATQDLGEQVRRVQLARDVPWSQPQVSRAPQAVPSGGRR